MNKPFSLSASERIKSKKNIETLFRSGEAFFAFPYRVVFIHNDVQPNSGLQMAVSVPKRFFKRAHDRNRVKRLTREAYRHQKQGLLQLVQAKGVSLQVMFVFQGKEMPDYKTCYNAVKKALNEIHKRIHPAPALPAL